VEMTMGVLDGIKVLEMARVPPAEMPGMFLADMGADVLKITAAHLPNLGYQEYDTGHGKLSAYLDLREPKDVETLTIKRKDDTVKLKRTGDGWEMLEPVKTRGNAGAGRKKRQLLSIHSGPGDGMDLKRVSLKRSGHQNLATCWMPAQQQCPSRRRVGSEILNDGGGDRRETLRLDICRNWNEFLRRITAGFGTRSRRLGKNSSHQCWPGNSQERGAAKWIHETAGGACSL